MDIEKLERQLTSLQKNLERGAKYLEQSSYYSAISEFTKVVDSLSDEAKTAKKDSHPPMAIALYLQILGQALIGRQMCYLSIGEKEKAQADEKFLDMVNDVINKINMQSKTELEQKKEESAGSSIGGCLGIIVSIIILMKLLGFL